jgi:hypothetical protein
MDGSRRKVGASKFGWKWGKKCNFFLQMARMILDARSLID